MSLSNWKLATAILAFSLVNSFPSVAADGQNATSLLTPEFADSTASAAAESRGYVAVGELQRIRRDDGTRRLALLDEAGSITAFLAPTARINLRRYLGQTVSVTARSVTRGEGKAPYVIPERVTPMGPRKSPSARPIATVGSSSAPAARTAGGIDEPIGSAVRPTSADVTIVDESPTYDSWEVLASEGPGPAEFEYVEGVHGAPPCESCGFQCGGGCGIGPCCGPWGRVFVRAEYLALWSKGMDIPALVTTSDPGTAPGSAGVLGLNSTDVLYGSEDILDDGHSGFRIRFGAFWDPCRRFGWEAEYFGFGDESNHFEARSDGNGAPILARPFFNMNPRVGGDGALDPPAREDAELVAFPGVLSGVVSVDSQTTLDSAGGRFRWNFCCKQIACHGRCVNPCGGPPRGFSRVDFVLGYRFLGLQDQLMIREDLTSLQANNPGRFEIFDHFETDNEFHGAEFGFVWEGGWRRWTLEFLTKMAVGNVHQKVAINGGTTISPLTQPQQTFEGGLLAQRSNIGKYSGDEFGLLNELGLTLGLHLTPRLRATVGYTFIYLTPVARAGDQIDLDVNPDLLPPEISPLQGPLRPQFAFEQTDYWADGINLGLDLRW